MVIDGGMDKVVARPTPRVPGPVLGCVAAMDAVATTWPQSAQLLDVQVDQLARVGALIAADQLAGRAVQERQPVEAMADQHPVDGGGRPATRGAIRAGPSLRVWRSWQISVSTAAGTRRGWVWAQLGRSASPAGPSWP